MYEVRETPAFRKSVRKHCSYYEESTLELYKERLAKNPFIGKPLGLAFFREIKIGSKRVFFVVHADSVQLLFAGHKNTQRKDIALLKKLLSF